MRMEEYVHNAQQQQVGYYPEEIPPLSESELPQRSVSRINRCS
jgi:hypothetical protein